MFLLLTVKSQMAVMSSAIVTIVLEVRMVSKLCTQNLAKGHHTALRYFGQIYMYVYIYVFLYIRDDMLHQVKMQIENIVPVVSCILY